MSLDRHLRLPGRRVTAIIGAHMSQPVVGSQLYYRPEASERQESELVYRPRAVRIGNLTTALTTAPTMHCESLRNSTKLNCVKHNPGDAVRTGHARSLRLKKTMLFCPPALCSDRTPEKHRRAGVRSRVTSYRVRVRHPGIRRGSGPNHRFRSAIA